MYILTGFKLITLGDFLQYLGVTSFRMDFASKKVSAPGDITPFEYFYSLSYLFELDIS